MNEKSTSFFVRRKDGPGAAACAAWLVALALRVDPVAMLAAATAPSATIAHGLAPASSCSMHSGRRRFSLSQVLSSSLTCARVRGRCGAQTNSDMSGFDGNGHDAGGRGEATVRRNVSNSDLWRGRVLGASCSWFLVTNLCAVARRAVEQRFDRR